MFVVPGEIASNYEKNCVTFLVKKISLKYFLSFKYIGMVETWSIIGLPENIPLGTLKMYNSSGWRRQKAV